MSSPGDVVGIESCVDLRSNDDLAKHTESSSRATSGGHRSIAPTKVSMKHREREFPPPISTAWNMRRYYTTDGRLIIKEEKALNRQREFFRADRSNGRLTLHLVREEIGNGDVLVDDAIFEMENVDDTSTRKDK